MDNSTPDMGGAPSQERGARWAGLSDGNSEAGYMRFMMHQMMGRQSTVKLVKIVTLDKTQPGQWGKAGAVDVNPLTNQTDGTGTTSKAHGSVYGLVYHRIQGGKNAVIIDPEPGDVGFAVVMDRDISGHSGGGNQANPGSFRRNDLSDGVYIGGCNNDKPSTYVTFVQQGHICLQPLYTDTSKKIWVGGDPFAHPEQRFSPIVTSAGPCITAMGRYA
jgi:hypothetical protein